VDGANRLAALCEQRPEVLEMKIVVRPFVLLAGLLVALAFAGGCGSGAEEAAARGGEGMPDPLVLGLIPAEDNQEVLRDYEPLVEYLSEELGTEVEPYTATDYSGIIEAMRSGKVDVAWFGPLSYVLAEEGAGAEAVAVPYEEEGEEPTYKSIILTQADNDEIQSLEDIEGKTFSFVDPSSTSGYLYPQKMLKDAGVDPEKDLAESRFAGGHDASILAIQNGNVDAGASWDGQLQQMIDAGAVQEDKIKIIARSEPIPKDPIGVRGDLPEDVKKQIQEAFLNATPETVGTENLGSEGALGYQETTDEEYDTVRELVDELELTEKQLLG
jgi:phosphonate transport system substrate-binding protein